MSAPSRCLVIGAVLVTLVLGWTSSATALTGPSWLTVAVEASVPLRAATEVAVVERPAVPGRLLQVRGRSPGGTWHALGVARADQDGRGVVSATFPESGEWDVQAIARSAGPGREVRSPLRRVTVRADDLTIIAHRGGADEAFENTMTAFRTALRRGATDLESDVRITAPGADGARALVLMHDAFLDGTTNAELFAGLTRKAVESLTPQQISFVLGDDGRPVPWLADLLGLLAEHPDVRLHLDLKTRTPSTIDLAVPVLEEIARFGVGDQVELSTFSIGSDGILPVLRSVMLQRPALAGPELAALLTDTTWSSRPTWSWLSANLLYQGPGDVRRGYLPEAIAQTHREQRRALVWTVDSLRTARHAADLGADGVITDRPDLMAHTLR